MKKTIKVKNREYSLKEFEKEFKQENWFQESYDTIKELNSPKKDASMTISIIGGQQKKYLITTKYVDEMYGLQFEEEEEQYLDPSRNKKHCKTEKEEQKVAFTIDLRKAKHEKFLNQSGYSSPKIHGKTERIINELERKSKEDKINTFWKDNCPKNDYKKPKSDYKKIDREKYLGKLKNIADVLLERI